MPSTSSDWFGRILRPMARLLPNWPDIDKDDRCRSQGSLDTVVVCLSLPSTPRTQNRPSLSMNSIAGM